MGHRVGRPRGVDRSCHLAPDHRAGPAAGRRDRRVGVAFASAICALVSKVNRYTEMAERGQELAGLYGQSLGLLMDLTTAGGVIKQPKARAAVVLFQQTKIRKDKLYRNPPRGEGETSKVADFVSRLRTARKMVEIARQQGAGQQGDPAGPSGVS